MVTLDLFTKKTKLYYIGLLITVITFSFIAVAAFYNLQSVSPFMPFYNALLIICSFTSVVFVVAAGTGLLRIYTKDGDLVVTNNYLIIDTVKISLDEINKLSISTLTRTNKSFILTKNNIEISDKKGNSFKRRFAIKSYAQNQDFQNILDSWSAQGLVYLRFNI